MDATEDPERTGASVPAPPLKSRRLTGEPYQRLEIVDNQIARLAGVPESQRASGFRGSRPEVVFHFIRNGGAKNPTMYQFLCVELARRTASRVRLHTRDYPPDVVEQVGMAVDLAVMKLALSGEPEREADFMEVNFYAAVEGRVRNALLSWRHSVMGGRRGWIQTDETDEEGEVLERTIELVPSEEPGAEEMLLVSAEKELVNRALRLASVEVQDPRQLQALILYYFAGWPVKSKDPKVASLVAYFGVAERTIWDWFSKTLKILYGILKALNAREVQ